MSAVVHSAGWAHRWRRRGVVGGADVHVPRVAASQELSVRHAPRQTRQRGPETGLPVRKAPVAGPQGESDPLDKRRHQ